MNRVVTAVFDGQVLRFDTPLDLKPNARYRISIKLEPLKEPTDYASGTLERPNERAQSPADDEDAWDVLERMAGTVDAPPDWSLEHDHYLYGTPKRYPENPE